MQTYGHFTRRLDHLELLRSRVRAQKKKKRKNDEEEGKTGKEEGRDPESGRYG